MVFALGSAVSLVVACGKADSQPSGEALGGGIFGGAGNIEPGLPIAGKSTGTSGSSSSMAGTNAVAQDCANTPQGMLALIDNFNDGDSIAAFEPAREAYWFTTHDESPGTIVPPKDFFPSADGYLGTKSAHVSVSGFTTWGAALVANISHKEALRCPYNASTFKGLSFVVRGSGTIRAQVVMPGVMDKEYGGTCDPDKGQVCFDYHGMDIALTPEFKTYELPWSSFLQRGFGTEVPFDSKTIFAIQFTMELANLPIDLWLDDVEFWNGVPTVVDPHAGGAGGAESAAGAANGDAGNGGADNGAGGGN